MTSSPLLRHSGHLMMRKNWAFDVDSFSTASFTREIDIDGRPLRLESGRLANMADGSAVGSTDGTSVLVTAVCKPKLSAFGGFLPLTVDYRHKWSAAGRIPTNYHRRDLGPSEFEILTSRIIDRSVRPLFPKGFCHDLQLSCNALSLDQSGDPVVATINAASTALLLSDIPWRGPVAAVRLACDPDQPNRCLINPTRRFLKLSPLNAVMAATSGGRIIMLDVEANDLPLEQFMHCVQVGLKHTERIIDQLLDMKSLYGKKERETLSSLFSPHPDLLKLIESIAQSRLDLIFDDTLDKLSRDKAVSEVKSETFQNVKTLLQDSNSQLTSLSSTSVDSNNFDVAFTQVCNEVFRRRFFKTGRRCDGRSANELRPITCSVGLFDSLHGSAVFQRGQTQVLCTLTLDSVEAALRNDAVSVLLGAVKEKMFMLTYEFPAYANNELGTSFRSNRRELGHGSLSERALRPLMPDEFGFATKLSCQVMESNGSSSMASVCAGSLALMDGGVPVKAPAAGVAIGLLHELGEQSSPGTSTHYSLLVDINGLEDFSGDMDFKVAGTKTGLTAVQLDVKRMDGLSVDMLRESLEKAHIARGDILARMAEQGLQNPRQVPKCNRPVVEEIIVPVNKRYRMMRTGGYTLRKLESDLGVQITQLDNQTYRIFAPQNDVLQEAKESIQQMLERRADQTRDLEFGAIYNAKIVEILENGVCVTLSPDSDPIFIPNSQLDVRNVRHPSALNLQIGQDLMVKYFGREPTSGRIRLSRKILLQTTASLSKSNDLFESAEQIKKISAIDSSSTSEDFSVKSPWTKKANGQS